MKKRKSPAKLRHSQASPFWLILSLLNTLFIILTYFVLQTSYFPLDLAVSQAIQKIQLPFFGNIMYGLSHIGFAPQILVVITFFVSFFYFKQMRREAIFLVVSAGSVGVLNILMKLMIQRERPASDLVDVITHLNDFSFPSSHVMFYTTFFGFLFYLAYKLCRDITYKYALMIFFAIPVLFIGLSRIFLGAHWLSDVIGGYLMGSIWLMLTIHFYSRGR